LGRRRIHPFKGLNRDQCDSLYHCRHSRAAHLGHLRHVPRSLIATRPSRLRGSGATNAIHHSHDACQTRFAGRHSVDRGWILQRLDFPSKRPRHRSISGHFVIGISPISLLLVDEISYLVSRDFSRVTNLAYLAWRQATDTDGQVGDSRRRQFAVAALLGSLAS
jgi:hypothetical protein